ncbi:MAG TPA: hypothetical protein DCM08_00595 [Microscillaceae bacterium]|jgi:hypothetical protein|nr:hypothetical protein [Microscillaceae bacterium]
MNIVIGIILMAAGVVLYFARQRSLNNVMNIKYHETSSIAELLETYQPIQQELGKGNFSQMVELKGVGSSNNPIKAELSGDSVLYYKAEVVRQYEVTVQRTDDKGNRYTDRETRYDTVSSNERFAPILLDDGTGGKIKVDLEGANIIAQKNLDVFERELRQGFHISFGGSDSHTIGYKYTEYVIPNNARLYVLGEAADRRGDLAVIKPAEDKNPFIVSTKSEEELIRSNESTALWTMVGAIAAEIGGIGFIISYFFQK